MVYNCYSVTVTVIRRTAYSQIDFIFYLNNTERSSEISFGCRKLLEVLVPFPFL